jgi:type III pantothenate kinase
VILAIDAGNFKIAFGAFDGDAPPLSTASLPVESFVAEGFEAEGPGAGFSRAINALGACPSDVEGVSISSVVPRLTPLLLEAAGGLTQNVLNLAPASFAPMPVRYRPPSDLGSDRLANALALRHLYGGPACSVDLGTATNFDVVSAAGEFVGGAIAPGLGTAADALWAKAARLQNPGWRVPERALGQSTADCLLSGTLLGYAGLVDEMVRLLAAEAGPFVRVVAAGGMAHIVSQAARTIDEVRPTLTLEGLNIAFRLSRPGGA